MFCTIISTYLLPRYLINNPMDRYIVQIQFCNTYKNTLFQTLNSSRVRIPIYLCRYVAKRKEIASSNIK